MSHQPRPEPRHAGLPIKTYGGVRYLCRRCGDQLGVCSCLRPVLNEHEVRRG